MHLTRSHDDPDDNGNGNGIGMSSMPRLILVTVELGASQAAHESSSNDEFAKSEVHQDHQRRREPGAAQFYPGGACLCSKT